MLYSEKSLKGFKLQAQNGEVGEVKEFYFDDHLWTIRYLVADTGAWLKDRKVLISPYALGDVNYGARTVTVKLTKEKIATSPGLDSDEPVSRKFEMDYFEYYGWPYLLGGSFGNYPYIQRDQAMLNDLPVSKESGDPNLRSMHEVTGYHIEANDGAVGHVKDFMIDDETWAIRYFVVVTHNWWPGKAVIISPKWIERISWPDSKVLVSLSREEIKQSPEFNENASVTREYETGLYLHYNRRSYWVDENSTRDHLIRNDSAGESGVKRTAI
jgi:hypothetical protein